MSHFCLVVFRSSRESFLAQDNVKSDASSDFSLSKPCHNSSFTFVSFLERNEAFRDIFNGANFRLLEQIFFKI